MRIKRFRTAVEHKRTQRENLLAKKRKIPKSLCMGVDVLSPTEIWNEAKTFLCNQDSSRVTNVHDQDVLPQLLYHLKVDFSTKIKCKVLKRLSLILAYGTDEQRSAVVFADAVPLVSTCCRSSNDERVMYRSVQFFDDLYRGNDAKLRDYLLQQGITYFLECFLVPDVPHSVLGLVAKVTRTLCCSINSEAQPVELAHALLVILCELMNHSFWLVLVHAVDGLSSLTDYKETCALVVSSGALGHLVSVLAHPHPKVRDAVVRMVRKMYLTSEENARVLDNCGLKYYM